MGEITALLRKAGGGDEDAAAAVMRLLYGELHGLARARLGGGARFADPTTLVHELYLRLRDTEGLDFDSRRHFMAYAARVMRSIVVDMARQRNAERRGAGAVHVPLDTGLAETLAASPDDALGVHEALGELEKADPRLANVVALRYFGGFSESEIALALGLTERTVQRDWCKARLLLAAMLSPESHT
jgi:RNA polymerase sigma factor (TIGR02999 family)